MIEQHETALLAMWDAADQAVRLNVGRSRREALLLAFMADAVDDRPTAIENLKNAIKALGKIALLALALALVACAEPDPGPAPLYDPTGTWSMRLTWDAGTCGLTGSNDLDVIVTLGQGEFLADTGVPTETATGAITQFAESARLDITVVNTDPLGDGGSAVGELDIDATAGRTFAITGTGEIRFTGSIACTQQHSVSGELE